MNLAVSRTLNEEDVWSISPYFAHKNLFHKQLNYRAECVTAKIMSFHDLIIDSNPSHSLFWFLIVSNSLDLILDLVFDMWTSVIGMLFHVLIQHL
jgi:hypothetical protein